MFPALLSGSFSGKLGSFGRPATFEKQCFLERVQTFLDQVLRILVLEVGDELIFQGFQRQGASARALVN